jgi:serine phosphatase RsbU (regulator of sigma subunit)
VVREKRPVWLDSVRSEGKFRAYGLTNSQWQELAPGQYPSTVKKSTIDEGVKAVIGIPMLSAKTVTGVLWLKFSRWRSVMPPNGFINQAIGFAGEAGLMLKVAQGMSDSADREITEESLRGRLERYYAEHAGLEVAARTLPAGSSRVGGDFFQVIPVTPAQVCVVLGDGNGHGIAGCMNMLPLLGAFQLLKPHSVSPTHIIARLRTVSKSVGVACDLISIVFSRIGTKLYACASSAGSTTSCIVLRRLHEDKYQHYELPDIESPARNVGFLRQEVPVPPDAEDRMELKAGDIAILFTDGVKDLPGLRQEDMRSIVTRACDDAVEKKISPRAETILDLIMNRIERAPEREDDATVVVVRC